MNIIEKTRIKNELSRKQMMKKLNITKSYYSMLASGKREISKKVAFKMNEEFGVPLDSVFKNT